MWRQPETDLDLAPLLATGRHAVGPGRYETLYVAGSLDDRPVLTFSCPDVAALGVRAPAAAYLATMVRGLVATHTLSAEETVDYLLAADGIDRSDGSATDGRDDRRAWDRRSLAALVTSVTP